MAEPSEKQATVRKAYGRGYHDGLKQGAKGSGVNQNKMASIERGLTGIAKKVFDCVPIGEDWTPSQICFEISRLTGSKADIKVVTGCLSSLVGQGLLREPVRGKYVRPPARVSVKPDEKIELTYESAPEKEVVSPTPQTSDPEPDRESLLARLDAELSTMRSLAEELRTVSSYLERTTSHFEALMCEMDDKAKGAAQGDEKLKQLRELLRSIAP